MELLSQNPQVSLDPETKGFDLSAGKSWIYPENYPLRDYQYDIVQAALYSNTLVCLPTGLGKTFIAAVVMYNYWRWYPRGKVVFLAPTKPLVAQQIYACHNIMGIPSSETIELTGAVNQKQREIAWFKKRVVFATPQVFHNDLGKGIVPGELVKCVVIDEAHKALGKHSYCECIRILSEKSQYFRVLGLSATPGNKIDNVHEVVQNLRIAHLELRDETSPDIIPYINQRKIDIILVPLSEELAQYKERYIIIMDRHVKVLLQCNVLQGHTANISKGRVFHLLKEFQKKTNRSGNYGQIIKTLNILMTMYHAYELMIRDGLRAFHKFYENHSDKFWMNDEIQLQNLLEDIKAYLGPFPDAKSVSEESIPDIPRNLVFGHTKFAKLQELLLRHFSNSKDEQNDTRAIVFVEYRDIVSEIYILLLQSRPLIRPQMFVGQAGQKQKQQIKALENFRNNHVNVLISTSIGEEGLDVGEVDLIICFDISQHSPTRLVQRMGRTGRKRDGHIIILVTDGREHETLKSTMARRDSLNNKILNTSNIFSSLYQNNPRMIPDVFKPECHKMHISVQPKTPIMKVRNKKEKPEKKKPKRQSAITKGVDTESKPMPKDGTQFSMTKFFRLEKHNEEADDVFETPNPPTIHSTNICNTIKSSDVKILSCDNDAVDFLTACALKRSEKEENEEKENVNPLYIPRSPAIKNFFNFSVPDIKILDCLLTLEETAPSKSNRDVSNVIGNDNDDASDHDVSFVNEYTLSNPANEISRKETIVESKFEDLLDESSKSNESDVSATEENLDINAAPASEPPIENRRKSPSLEPGMFEDILNESSDSSDNNEHTECLEQEASEILDFSENIKTGSALIDVQSKNHQESVNTDVKKAAKITTDFTRNFEDNKENESELSNRPKSKNNAMFSITQAIHEIARINSKTEMRRTVDVSEDDIFQDGALETQMNYEKSFDPKEFTIDRSMEERCIEADLDEPRRSTKSSDVDGLVDQELAIEDFDWNDEFEVSPAPVASARCFENPKPSCSTPDTSRKPRANFRTEYADSNAWISVEKSFNEPRKNISLAKKLANVKRITLKSCGSRNLYNDTDNSEDESVINKEDFKESTESESSWFFDKSKSFEEKSSERSTSSKYRGILSRKRQENSEIRNKNFEVFAAPKKYLPRQKTSVHFGRSTERKESSSSERDVNKKRKRIRNEFIEEEADVSVDASSDESSGVDEDLADFVSYTQNVHDNTDMQVHYLQSVRSPIKRRNAFLFKEQRSPDPDVEIYSQPLTQAQESYLNDSFCVAGDENDDDNEPTRIEELSVLERAERELERKKRKRSRDEESEDNLRKTMKRKRRRNILNDISSSEDETEKLRKQIQDESLLLARSCQRD